MDFNISKIAQQSYGAGHKGLTAPALKSQPLKQAHQGQEGLVARLNNINGELTPSHKGGINGNKLDYLA